MNKQDNELLQKYSQGTCTEQEKAIVETWYAEWNNKDRVKLSEQELLAAEKLMRTRMFGYATPAKVVIWPRVAIAAAVLICLSIAAYWIIKPQGTEQFAIDPRQDIAPGGSRATLILSNGKQLLLTNARQGRLANEGNTLISKTANNQIAYNTGAANAADTMMNTLVTPIGGEYSIMLADGTRVMLNSQSVLKFPASFAGTGRRVELEGEAYFEVAHNAAKPFMVSSRGQMVKVLGTHFDVNAYADERRVKTTLVEGSVNVAAQGSNKTILPGQMTVFAADRLTVKDADLEKEVAWKDGYFRFDGENIHEVMRTIARWYNIKVVFEGNATQEFKGKISKYKNISQVLKMLEKTGAVHFKVEEGRVTVVS